MAYNEELDLKIEEVVSHWGAIRKKMFGGTCYLLKGNMMCGVYKDYLILRLGEKQTQEILSRPHVKPFDITGRPMKGWVMVEEAGLKGKALSRWLEKARAFVAGLPPR
jgi:TfoX/Sxy family transcriptional regulator of competence genes